MSPPETPLKIEAPLAITMWDFSWIERRWPGAGYESWDLALDELAERGYNAVRIDAFPHLVAENPSRTWEILPVWTTQAWGSPAKVRIQIQPSLSEFISKCAARKIKVGLSTWFRQDSDDLRQAIASPRRHAEIWARTLETLKKDGVLDSVLYVDLCNEWPLYLWAPFFKGGPQGARDWDKPESLVWMRTAVKELRNSFPGIPLTFSFTPEEGPYATPDLSWLDFLEPHLWMANCTSFYRQIDYNYERFEWKGYDALVRHAEKLYRSDPGHWQSSLACRIEDLAEWSRAHQRPLITTECWGVVDYRDWPGLDWGWVKELCEFGVQKAVATGRWAAVATSNFCGPQFVGMWRDVEWHRRLTSQIRSARLPC
ncbi:MAG: cellulase-like family protein [Opitutaceae bacterium]|nr:cellulase-like family protein [Opitutaceae bacterium]